MKKPADKCKRAIDRKKGILRLVNNPGIPGIIYGLMPILIDAGMTKARAAQEVWTFIKAWDPKVDPSTPDSIRVRYLQRDKKTLNPCP